MTLSKHKKRSARIGVDDVIDIVGELMVIRERLSAASAVERIKAIQAIESDARSGDAASRILLKGIADLRDTTIH